MKKVHLFSDFDGTITQRDTLVYLATNLGAGKDFVQAIGQELRAGRMSLRDAIAEEIRGVRLPFDEAARILLREIELDPGFDDLVRWSQSKEIPFTILSAGFHEIIDLFVTSEAYPWISVMANHVEPNIELGWQCRFRDEGPYGHDKAKSLRAARNRGEYVLFIGDGLSDRQAAEEADEVFAKHSLFEYCREHGINCHEYQTLADVRAQLQREW